MNFREKYVLEYLEFCQRHYHLLNDWERAFVDSIRGVPAADLAARQYNALRRTAERLTDELA